MTYKEYDEEVERAKEFLRKASEPKEFFVCWTWYFEDPDSDIIECTHEDNVHYQYYYHIDACNASEAKKKFLLDRYHKEWLDAESSESFGAIEWREDLKKESVRYLIEAICACYELKGYITNYECCTKDIQDKYLKKRNIDEECGEIVVGNKLFDKILEDLDVNAIISEMSEEDIQELYMDTHWEDVIAIAMNSFLEGDNDADKLGGYSSFDCSEE